MSLAEIFFCLSKKLYTHVELPSRSVVGKRAATLQIANSALAKSY